MGEVAVQQTPAQMVVSQIRSEQFKEQAAMVLPENVPVSRFVRATATALLANPDIAKIEDTDSLFAALFKSAQDGLLPDGREAAIVAYGKKATYLPMIGGVIKIAGEHGWSMSTRVVYSNDEFDYELGLNERIDHKPAQGERGDRVYAYAIARHRDGRAPMVEVMDAAEIEKVKKVSRGSARGPWVDWPERMWEKSVGHRLFKRLPLDPGDKRVARMIIDAEEIGPGGSAELMYGTGATFREIEAPKDTPAATADAAHIEAGGGQQEAAEEVASGDEPGLTAPSAAAPDEPPAPAPEQTAFAIPDSVIDEAAAFLVVHNDPDNGWNGWEIEKVITAKDGPAWLAWACGAGGEANLSAETVANVRLYVEHRQASIWEAVNAE